MNDVTIIIIAEIIAMLIGVLAVYFTAGPLGRIGIKLAWKRRLNKNVGLVRIFDAKGEPNHYIIDLSKENFSMGKKENGRTYIVLKEYIYYLPGGIPCLDYEFDKAEPLPPRNMETTTYIDNAVFDNILLKAASKPTRPAENMIKWVVIGIGIVAGIAILTYLKVIDIKSAIEMGKAAQPAVQTIVKNATGTVIA